LSGKYKIAESESYIQKIGSKKYDFLYGKILEDVYPTLRLNPFRGRHIKKLKGKYKNYRRFRIGDYRLIYRIDKLQSMVFVADIKTRQSAYK